MTRTGCQVDKLHLLQGRGTRLDESIKGPRVGDLTMSDGYHLKVKGDEENSLQKSATCRPKSTQLERPPKREHPLRYLGLPAG